jgi:excisionase family DNA binding protein
MRLLSVKEISEMLRVKSKTIYQWAELGQIPCLKINGLLRFSEEEVRAWISDCRLGPDVHNNRLAGRRPGKEGRF